jgi:hypothetical protein
MILRRKDFAIAKNILTLKKKKISLAPIFPYWIYGF